jgi:uncharacterized protein YkwD
MRGGTAVLALAVLGVLCTIGPVSNASAETPTEKRLLNLIDSTRRAHGLPALRDSESLCRSARRMSLYIMVHDRFGHLARIRASGRFRLKGEALAIYSGWRMQPHRVLRMWMNSPPHRELLLSRRMRFAGVGAKAGHYGSSRMTAWTLHLGRY